VSTKPTPAGNDVLDPFHPYGITKHLQEKPVRVASTASTLVFAAGATLLGSGT
jgi:hypothetical protein